MIHTYTFALNYYTLITLIEITNSWLASIAISYIAIHVVIVDVVIVKGSNTEYYTYIMARIQERMRNETE